MADSVEEVTKVVIEDVNDVKEPLSPETRLIPEDLSVNTTKTKENNSTEILPLKTPELKLSVRKLLGCSPSPPPPITSRELSPKSENDFKTNHLPTDGKNTSVEAKVSSQFTRPFGVHDDTTKGEHFYYYY